MAENEIKEAFASCCEDHGECNPFHQGQAFVTTAAEQLKAHGTEQVELIIATAKQVYDQWVAPFDIPGIPNLVEPTVDRLIWQAIEAAVRTIASRMS